MLRRLANDPRWRTREAVAMALQDWGRADLDALLAEMEAWSRGSYLEQRAAAAGLCEPVLLENPAQVERVLAILDAITEAMTQAADRKNEDFLALRKGMAYCWSVAAVGHPPAGKAALEKWLESPDRDVRWVIKQNLSKKRLERMDPVWVAEKQALLK